MDTISKILKGLAGMIISILAIGFILLIIFLTSREDFPFILIIISAIFTYALLFYLLGALVWSLFSEMQKEKIIYNYDNGFLFGMYILFFPSLFLHGILKATNRALPHEREKYAELIKYMGRKSDLISRAYQKDLSDFDCFVDNVYDYNNFFKCCNPDYIPLAKQMLIAHYESLTDESQRNFPKTIQRNEIFAKYLCFLFFLQQTRYTETEDYPESRIDKEVFCKIVHEFLGKDSFDETRNIFEPNFRKEVREKIAKTVEWKMSAL